MNAISKSTLKFPALVLSASRRSRIVVLLLALSVGALGLVNLWSAILAHGPGRAKFLHDVVHLPLLVEHGTRTLVVLSGLGLLMLARSLANQKRQAWTISVVVLIIAPFLHLVKGLDWEEAVICIGLLWALFTHRALFWAENDRPSARQGVTAAFGLIMFALLYGPLGFLLLRHEFRPRITLRSSVGASLQLLSFSSQSPDMIAKTRRAQWFEDSLVIISVAALSFAAFMLLRPVLPRDRTSEEQRQRVAQILRRWGGSPIAYYSLLLDKQYLISDRADGQDWCLAYKVVGHSAVALGDPLGAPDLMHEAISSFIDLCRRHDWKPVFYQVDATLLDTYQSLGLRSLKVGQDAVIDLETFALRGKKFQDLRTAINKMSKLSIAFEEFRSTDTVNVPLLNQLSEVSDEWLESRHGVEKNFAMGAFAPQSELFWDSRVFIARDVVANLVLGFVTLVPVFGPGANDGSGTNVTGWALDLMRRRHDAVNGVMEFLIASSCAQLQEEGRSLLSLGLSPLSGADNEDDPHDLELFVRARQLLFRRFNFAYSFDGLFAFKNKFAPNWTPRYLVYDGHPNLLGAIYAVLEAHSRHFVMIRLRNLLTTGKL